jgi:hypothetical protein
VLVTRYKIDLIIDGYNVMSLITLSVLDRLSVVP